MVDLFRYPGRRPGLNLALKGMSETLRQRKATPSEIADYAHRASVWTALQPYLEAMTANG